MYTDIKQNILAVFTAIFLLCSYIGIGFGVCSGSPTPTRLIASATINDAGSPFSKDELVRGAVATQEYSFATHDQEAYLTVISEMNAQANTPYAEYDKNQIIHAPVQYGITQNELDHLNDVYNVANTVIYPIVVIIFLAAFLLFIGNRYFGPNVVSRALLWSGVATIALIAILLAWALVSFSGLFAVFHSLFFAEGTWTFPADSLLITMLPESFWIGIGAVWISISAILAVASVVVGIIIKRKSHE